MRRSRNLWKWTVSVLWFKAEPQCREKTTRSGRAAGYRQTSVREKAGGGEASVVLLQNTSPVRGFFTSTLSHRGVHLELNLGNPWNSSVSSSRPAGWTSSAKNQMFLPSKNECNKALRGGAPRQTGILQICFLKISPVDSDQSQGLIGHCGRMFSGFYHAELPPGTLRLHVSATVSLRVAFIYSSQTFEEKKKKRFAGKQFQNFQQERRDAILIDWDIVEK